VANQMLTVGRRFRHRSDLPSFLREPPRLVRKLEIPRIPSREPPTLLIGDLIGLLTLGFAAGFAVGLYFGHVLP
jgi:hypothetical protein